MVRRAPRAAGVAACGIPRGRAGSLGGPCHERNTREAAIQTGAVTDPCDGEPADPPGIAQGKCIGHQPQWYPADLQEPVSEGENALLTFRLRTRTGVQIEEVSSRVVHARMDDDVWVVGLKFNDLLDRQSTPLLVQAAARQLRRTRETGDERAEVPEARDLWKAAAAGGIDDHAEH